MFALPSCSTPGVGAWAGPGIAAFGSGRYCHVAGLDLQRCGAYLAGIEFGGVGVAVSRGLMVRWRRWNRAEMAGTTFASKTVS